VQESFATLHFNDHQTIELLDGGPTAEVAGSDPAMTPGFLVETTLEREGDIMARLTGKVAVVTGGNSGIGLATAKRFHAEGAKIVISGRDQKTLDEAVKAIGGDVVAVRGDVSKLADLDKLYKTVGEAFGKIDVLFANAGIAKFAPFAESTETLFDETFDVNVKGVYFAIQKALPLLNDGSSIIINASVASESGVAGASVYSATKAAVRSFAGFA
jgi:NAD(P)-dependent dehydrogenase (short-subunit alcohol dehydrogenase family)